MSGRLLTFASLALLAPFSGCIFLNDEVESRESIVRKVVASLDGSLAGEATRFEDVVRTSFEYEHAGGDVSPEDVEVEFLAEDGHATTRSLSRYTTKSTLKAGDIVTIDRVNLTSDLKLTHAGNVLASRSGLRQDWFSAEGVPIPIRSTQDGLARYTVTGGAEINAKGSDFDVEDYNDEGGIHVETVAGSFKANVDGSMKLTTDARADGPRLTGDAKLHATLAADLDSAFSQDGTRQEAGFDADLASWTNGTFMFQFDTGHRLKRVGFGADEYADGDVVAWDADHPKSQRWHPEDMEHPLVDEKTEYSEEDVGDSGDEPSRVVKEFMERLWSMTLVPGDEFRLEASHEEESAGSFDLSVVVQVVSKDVREVGGQKMDTLRISQSASFVTQTSKTGRTDFDVAKYTVWVSADHYIPVYEQGKYEKTFDREDLRRMHDALGSAMPFSVPDDAAFALAGETTVRLDEFSGDLTAAPLVAVSGVTGMGQSALGAAAVFFFVSDIGSNTAQAAPSIGWTVSEAEDEWTVAEASAEVYWWDFELLADRDAGYRLNGATPYGAGYTPLSAGEYQGIWGEDQLAAGDSVQFCGSEGTTFTLRHGPSNTVVQAFTFASLLPCV